MFRPEKFNNVDTVIQTFIDMAEALNALLTEKNAQVSDLSQRLSKAEAERDYLIKLEKFIQRGADIKRETIG